MTSPAPSSNNQAPAPRSYAHATKSSVSGPIVVGSGTNNSAAQHGKRESVNVRAPSANMAAPAIVNSSAANGGPGPTEHTRKPSVTISASGATGQIPNGGPQTPNGPRPNISFGSMNANGSPAIANSTTYQPQTQQTQQSSSSSSLPAPQSDPRITSPAHSPTPIPGPTTSGGRPPSGLGAQGNAVNFGSIGGEPGPQTEHRPSMPGVPQPGMMPGQPNTAHFRRASSQSHGDFSPSMPMGPGRGGNGYMSQRGGRGGGYHQGYPPMQPSPGPNYRGMQPYQQRPGTGSVPPHFQNQVGPPAGSPHAAPRSPAPMGSQPGTPSGQPLQMHHGQPMYPTYEGYNQQMQQSSGQFAMQSGYNPQYNYYQPPFAMHPQYLPGTPQSPQSAQFRQRPPPSHQQPPYGVQGQYPPNHSPNMSRSTSQVSEQRPTSSLSQSKHAPQPSLQSNNMSHNHSQSTSATSNSNFKIPTRQSKGIVIKNAEGEVVTFDNKKTSPAPPAASHSPAPSNPTPPPRTASSSSHKQSRSESVSGKSVAQIQAEFKEQVKREHDKEPQIKEEDAGAAQKGVDVPKVEEPAVSQQDPAENAAVVAEKRAEKPQVDETPVDVPAPREDSKAQEAVTERQDAEIKSAPAPAAAPTPVPEIAKPAEEPKETEEEKRKREQDEEMERMIAEMEQKEREEEEKEKAYQEKKQKEAAEKAAREKDEKANADERMKQAERDAEALEEAREAERAKEQEKSNDDKADDDKLFASLKKPTLGPGAEAETPSTTPSTPQPDEGRETMPPPQRPISAVPKGTTQRQKPAALKLETAKAVEPAQPTPGMRSLRSARLLQLRTENVTYPEGIQSPNPALNNAQGRRGGMVYDKDFLLQFQNTFKEKPVLDWDQKLKDTLGDPSDSAVPKSARTPGPRSASHHQRPAPNPLPQPMGSFTGRTIPPGSTSEARFAASSRGGAMSTANLQSRFSGGTFPMGQGMPGRAPSMGNIPMHAQQASRDNRSKQGSKGPRHPSAKEQAEMNKKMPLTASVELKPLEASGSGWKPTSVGRPGMATAVDPSGLMAPDMVQRKVKSNLNKMTPERFEKIGNEVLKIAGQSEHETDGRTLRQVIALLFEKACDEAHWASMYARFASRMLTEMSSEIKDDNIKDRSGNPVIGGALFRKYLLNRCQEEFERGWEVNLPLNAEGQQGGEAAMMSDEYYKAAAAKRKGLGLVQFIGELYKLGMLSAKIMHTCVKKLLDFEGEPDESSIESLCKLLRTVGSKLEEDAGAQILTAYFTRIDQIMNYKGLPSRMYFMLLDVVDLRKAGWQSKDNAKGPKTITEIHEEAALAQQKAEIERAKQSQRGGGRPPPGRGDARNFSGGPMPPPDYNRNTLGTDELRKLTARKNDRQTASGLARGLGPSSMLGSRSNSGRGLGPGSSLMSRTASSGGSSPAPPSGLHSRSTSMAKLDKKDDEPKTNVNAFSALAGIEGDGQDRTPSSSPPVTKSQPVGSSSNKNEDSNAGAS